MSITEQQTALPTGTYTADRVHSSVAFEVEYMGIGAFGGTVKEFDATLEDGRLSGSARIESLETKDENLLRPPDVARVLRRGAPPRVVRSRPSTRQVERLERPAPRARSRSRASPSPPTLTGTIVGPRPTPTATSATGSKLETTIDRTAFGITWNNDMPNGTKALSDEVTLKADLSLVKAA